MASLKILTYVERLHLIKRLLEELKTGNIQKIHLLNSLIETSLAASNNTTIMVWLKDLLQYCDNVIAQGGDTSHAFFIKARMHYYGYGCDKNARISLELYEKAALSGSTAMNNLAYMYSMGKGCDTNHARASELLSKAYESGSHQARVTLAVLYEQGIGYTLDKDRAIQLYQEGVEMGNIQAMYFLGKLYEEMQCYDEAAELYRKQ